MRPRGRFNLKLRLSTNIQNVGKCENKILLAKPSVKMLNVNARLHKVQFFDVRSIKIRFSINCNKMQHIKEI